MFYIVKIWDNNDCFLKKEILYQSDNDVNAMQKASAATPDGCRATYESIDKEKYEKEKTQKTKEEETVIEQDIAT